MYVRTVLVCALLTLSGCATIGYYSQSVGGHLELMGKSRPIEEVLEDPETDPRLRQRLELVSLMRAFSVSQLHLPDNDSYRSYANVEREAVVWSVVATPEFSMEPREWCYPVVGCASYRGYFDRAEAEAFAEGLRQAGSDVAVQAVPAYSTLGWFDDPLPSTVIHWPEGDLAGMMFHELAHQRLYLPGDSAFNEAFAMTVERAGMERWFRHRGDKEIERRWREGEQRERTFIELILRTRERLQRLYARALSPEAMGREKALRFEQLRAEYVELKAGWGGYGGFDHWFEREVNNAHLASIATYEQWVPAFEALLKQSGGRLDRFYEQSEALAALPEEERNRRLNALLSGLAP
jgi:predicted aminopeptidase